VTVALLGNIRSMEPGGIEFVDEHGAAVPLDRADDQLAVAPGGSHRVRGPVVALAVAALVVCGGVLWNQHSNGAKQPTSATATPARISTVQPPAGLAIDTGIRPTGELLAEAKRELGRVRGQLLCETRVRTELLAMGAAYRAALAAGGSPREAERAARAVLADAPDAGVPDASYDAMFRIWLVNRTALSKLSGERLSIDMGAVCPG